MPLEIDLDTLRLLDAIQRHGSLSKAAVERGISQPAASARIKSFETRWRLAVLRRTPRGSHFTSDGDMVVTWARSVLHAADTMGASLAALTGERQGMVAVAASFTVAEHILPRWLGELHTLRPAVSPTLAVVNSERVIDHVRTGVADIGFIESVGAPAGLEHMVVGRDRLTVVVAPDHQWARRSSAISVEELERARWVLRESGSGTRSTFETVLGCKPSIALEGTSTTALIGAAIAGVGPAVVSARSVRTELATGRLRAVETELDLWRPLTAIWLGTVRLPDPARDLLRIAVASTRDAPPDVERGTNRENAPHPRSGTATRSRA